MCHKYLNEIIFKPDRKYIRLAAKILKIFLLRKNIFCNILEYGKLNAAKRGGRGDFGGGNARRKDREDGNRSKNGSSGSNRRIVSKPPTKHISKVNLLPVKPRVLKKPTQKLLKDPKENEKIKSEVR